MCLTLGTEVKAQAKRASGSNEIATVGKLKCGVFKMKKQFL